MKVGGIAGNEDATYTVPGDLMVMDAEVAGSAQGASFLVLQLWNTARFHGVGDRDRVVLSPDFPKSLKLPS